MCHVSNSFRFDRFDVKRGEIVRPIEAGDERNLFGVIRPDKMNDVLVDLLPFAPRHASQLPVVERRFVEEFIKCDRVVSLEMN